MSKKKKQKLNVDLMHIECTEIGLIYSFGIPNVIKKEYIRLEQYAPQDTIKATLYNSLFNAKMDINMPILLQKFYSENDIWIRGRQKRQAQKEKKQAIKIMKNKKRKIKIPKGYEIVNEFSSLDQKEEKRIVIELKPIKKELPKTWEEYCTIVNMGPHMTSCKYSREVHALQNLLSLRDHYNATEIESNPYSIYKVGNGFASTNNTINRGPIVLNSTKLGIEFVQNFRDLIIEALPLL